MRLLKNAYFLNSGSMLYSSVNLDGNIHINGKNGSGKTSILRALLFFYNPEGQNQGISSNQKNFVDFYFPYPNSYIVFEVEKENFTYLIISYKRQNRICFRIAETIFREEYFINEKRIVKTLQEVVESFHFNNVYIYPKTLDTYKDFKSMIYGSENDLKRYSIFEGKALNYQSIPRTISNIFHNHKLEASFIKRSIMNSIMEEMPTIELIKIKNQLGDFDKSFNDIKSFESHLPLAKLICKIYSRLLELEADKREISRMLGYRTNFAKEEKMRLVRLTKELEIQLADLKKQQDNLKAKYYSDEKEISVKIEINKRTIESAEKKKKAYQADGIAKIIEAVESESSLDKQLNIINDELAFLLSEHQDIKKKYDDLKNVINQNIREKEIEFSEKKLIADTQKSQEKEEIKKLYDQLVQELKNKYQNSFDEIETKRRVLTEENTNLQVKLSKIEVSVPFSEKLNEIKDRLAGFQKEISERKSALQKLEGQLKLYQQELNSKIKEKSTKLKNLEERKLFEIKRLEIDLFKIEENLNLAEKSFSGFLEKNYPGHQETISKVISEEVMFSTELDPEIIEKNDLLFGIKVNLSKLNPAKTMENYMEQRDQLLIDISRHKQELENILLEIKNKFAEEENSLNKKIKENENTQAKLKKEAETFKIHFETAQNQLHLKQEESDKQRQLEITRIEEELLHRKSVFSTLNSQYLALKKELIDEINVFEEEKQVKLESLSAKNRQFIENLRTDLNDFKQGAAKKIAEIDLALQGDLQAKGANEPKIRELEDQKQKMVKQKNFIEINRQKYHEYLKDKRELFDRLEEFQSEISRAEKEKEEKLREYSRLKSEFDQVFDSKNVEYNTRKKALSNLTNELENYEGFKNGPLFAEIAHYLSEENFFLTNEKKISVLINDLTSIYHELTGKANNLRQKVTEYTSFLDDNNIFAFKVFNNSDQDFLNFAKNLTSFIEEDKLKESQELLSKNYSLLVSYLSNQIEDLTSKEDLIHKTINKINNSFEKARKIDVIKEIELRVKESNNLVINYLRKIREFYQQNPFVGDFNLFNQSPSQENELKAIELLKKLKQAIQESKLDKISLEESFEIELRVMENNNDSGFTERISNIGSNGTDVLVKSLIYITLLDVAKSRLKSRDFKIHCILDEVGILDNNYLKYLMQFANEKDILLINSSPNPAKVLLYKHRYQVMKNHKSNSEVKTVISDKINETINKPGPDTASAN